MPAAIEVKRSGMGKIKANGNTSNKFFGENIRQLLHKNNV